jgi:hypothetical protein
VVGATRAGLAPALFLARVRASEATYDRHAEGITAAGHPIIAVLNYRIYIQMPLLAVAVLLSFRGGVLPVIPVPKKIRRTDMETGEIRKSGFQANRADWTGSPD